MLDNILASRLYRPGSVAYVARSGGMSNELNNIINQNTDGVFEGVRHSVGDSEWFCVLYGCTECVRENACELILTRCMHMSAIGIGIHKCLRTQVSMY